MKKNHITLDGKQYPFAITYGTMAALEESHGIEDIAEAFGRETKGRFGKILAIVYEGIKSGCKREKEDFNMTFDEFKDIDIRASDLAGLNTVILNCMVPDESPNAAAAVPKKPLKKA